MLQKNKTKFDKMFKKIIIFIMILFQAFPVKANDENLLEFDVTDFVGEINLAIGTYTTLKSENSHFNSDKIEHSLGILETQLTNGVIKLNWIINNHKDTDTDNVKNILNKIVIGIRNNYISSNPKIINSDKYSFLFRGNFITINLKKIFNSIEVPKKEELEYLRYFEKYSFKDGQPESERLGVMSSMEREMLVVKRKINELIINKLITVDSGWQIVSNLTKDDKREVISTFIDSLNATQLRDNDIQEFKAEKNGLFIKDCSKLLIIPIDEFHQKFVGNAIDKNLVNIDIHGLKTYILAKAFKGLEW